LQHGTDGFTSPKEGVLLIFIANENPSPLVSFEPANLGSNGEHDNHYTTEDDFGILLIVTFVDLGSAI
jgi:hypothetical protein